MHCALMTCNPGYLQGNLPLHLCAIQGFTEIAVFLMSKHFSMLQVHNAQNQTASDLAFEHRRVRASDSLPITPHYLLELSWGAFKPRTSCRSRQTRTKDPFVSEVEVNVFLHYLAGETPHDSNYTFHQAVIQGDLRAVLFALRDHENRHHVRNRNSLLPSKCS